MTIAFWAVGGLLALGFLAAGLLKLTRSKEQAYAAGLTWTEDYSERTLKTIGALEVLGALGVILPAATGIAPVLSPIAAICLGVIMVLAIRVHVRRKEAATPAIALLVLAVATAVLGFMRLG